MLTVIPILVGLLSATHPAQSSVELKLKLREDETVRYRHVLNVTTFTPNDINERVASGQMAFTFGAPENGKIPVTMRMEEYEGLDPGTNNSAEGMRQIEVWFEIDNRGHASDVEHKVSQPGLQPLGALLSRTLNGMMSLGFLGWHMPEGRIQTGHKWTQTVAASDYLDVIFAPAGNAFEPFGDLEATFTLVDLLPVNKKPHARISIEVQGTVDVDLHFPPDDNSGIMTVNSSTSLLVDLETGLVTRSKTDGSVEIAIGEFHIQIMLTELLYVKKT